MKNGLPEFTPAYRTLLDLVNKKKQSSGRKGADNLPYEELKRITDWVKKNFK